MHQFAALEPSDLLDFSALIADCFNMDGEKCKEWISRCDNDFWRVLKSQNGTLLGGLLRIPMAQWYHSKAVSMTGLAGVGVSASGRGLGAGQALMRETLQEFYDEGVALSALYGSTTSFYRRCGYERAGSNFTAEIPLRDITGRGGPLEVRPLTTETQKIAEQLQAEAVRGQACLLRGPYLWKRIRGPRGKVAQGFGFYRGDQMEGYVYLIKDSAGFGDNSLEVTDMTLPTPDAVQTFLGFLAGHRAFFHTATWPSAAGSAVLLALPEPWQYTLRLHEHWLLRIVNLKKALEERGYQRGAVGELHLRVQDPWFSSNTGAFILSVEDGRGTLVPGGRGDLGTDIRSLAALYSGFLRAEELALTGHLSGQPETLRLATHLFGGAVPELIDFF